jgi:hypothetical protein
MKRERQRDDGRRRDRQPRDAVVMTRAVLRRGARAH